METSDKGLVALLAGFMFLKNEIALEAENTEETGVQVKAWKRNILEAFPLLYPASPECRVLVGHGLLL